MITSWATLIYDLNVVLVCTWTMKVHDTVVSRKRAHGRYTLLHAQTGGWGADICNIAAFYHEKVPTFILSQPTTGYCKPTHLPSTSLIQFSVCISQACVTSRKWTSAGGVLTFQGRDSKFHAMNFIGKTCRVEKLIRIFQKPPQ